MRLGLLGAGSVALHHARAASSLGHEVFAASARSTQSPRWKAFAEAIPGARFVADGDDLLADAGVDAVVCCLPWDVIEGWLPRLLASPKPVLIEKPLSLSRAPLEAALAGARLEGKAVGFNRRFYEPVESLRARLAQGGLRSAELVISEDVASQVERHGEGIVPHLPAFASSHALDLALYLLGPLAPAKVYARPSGGFTSYTGVLETGEGVPVLISWCSDDPSPAGLRCRFSDGTAWHLSPLEVLRVYSGHDVLPAEPGWRIRRYVPRLRDEVRVDGGQKPGFSAQMKAFLEGGDPRLARPADWMNVLALIDAVADRA